SAHSEIRLEPEKVQPDKATQSEEVTYSRMRGFGSLAQEALNAGVRGVVAMRYNVYVVTAAQFVAGLYQSLANGYAIGEAVTLGRNQLSKQPIREISFQPRPLQDWLVPIVYESSPVALFTSGSKKAEPEIFINANEATPVSGNVDAEIQKQPDAGF